MRHYMMTEKKRNSDAKHKKSYKGRISHRRYQARAQERMKGNPERWTKRQINCRKSEQRRTERNKEFPKNLKGHIVDGKRVIILSDVHFPFEDPDALELALCFTKKWKPDTVILNGDIVDNYSASRFDKDPLKVDTVLSEMQKSNALMERISKIRSIKNKIWVGGNHEDRWKKIIWREANSRGGLSPVIEALMYGLDVNSLNPEEAFARAYRIPQNGFVYYPYGHYVELAEQNLVVTHGFMISQHSGYTAKRHFERIGKSVIVGHSHRQGSYFVSQMGNPKGAWEQGCLCDLNPEYMQFPNWQLGFAGVSIEGNLFHVNLFKILPDYKLEYDGKIMEL